MKAEELFRRETCDAKMTRIDTQKLVEKLVKSSDVVSIFNEITQNITEDADVKHTLLKNMCALFLRVKAFSKAKDITTNYLMVNKKKAQKKKALRKDLKILSQQKPEV